MSTPAQLLDPRTSEGQARAALGSAERCDEMAAKLRLSGNIACAEDYEASASRFRARAARLLSGNAYTFSVGGAVEVLEDDGPRII